MSTRLGVAVSAALEAVSCCSDTVARASRRSTRVLSTSCRSRTVRPRRWSAVGSLPRSRTTRSSVRRGGDIPEAVVRGRLRWYVDPLDGTTNFLQGSPRFGVSIAWCSPDDHVEVGVVYAPATDELFTAEAGGGSRLNGDPLRVSDVRLEDAVIGSGFPYDFDGPTNQPAGMGSGRPTGTQPPLPGRRGARPLRRGARTPQRLLGASTRTMGHGGRRSGGCGGRRTGHRPRRWLWPRSAHRHRGGSADVARAVVAPAPVGALNASLGDVPFDRLAPRDIVLFFQGGACAR